MVRRGTPRTRRRAYRPVGTRAWSSENLRREVCSARSATSALRRHHGRHFLTFCQSTRCHHGSRFSSFTAQSRMASCALSIAPLVQHPRFQRLLEQYEN